MREISDSGNQGECMSENSTPVTPSLFDYVAAHTVPEDDFLRTLKRAAIAAGLPRIWIAPEQGSLLQLLLRIARAREVVEVGTLAGYSAIWMARALPEDGRVQTIEVSSKHADFAERHVAASDVARKIKIYRGAAKDLLPKFQSDSADAFFIDADKANYLLYFKQAMRIVRRGGLIMADNAFAFGEVLSRNGADPEVKAVRSFNETVAHNPALHSLIVPIGDGLMVSVKL